MVIPARARRIARLVKTARAAITTASRTSAATPAARGKSRALVGLAQSVGAVARSARRSDRGGIPGRGFLRPRLPFAFSSGGNLLGQFTLVV
jgi:hypothetical protein